MGIKKIIATTLLATSMLTLAGCAKGKASEEVNSDNPTTSSDKLVMAIWDTNQLNGIQEIVNGFTEETGVEVDIQVTPWTQYWTMLEAGATGGELPDVFWMHSNEFAKYAQYDMLLDLTDRIEESEKIDLENYPKEIVDLYNWNNEKQFAVPKDIDTIALWYNKTMFDEAGLEYPNADWTWDDFKEAAKKLTKSDGSQYGYTLSPSDNQEGWYNMVYSMGGAIISDDRKTSKMDDPNTIKAIEYASSFVKEGLTPKYEIIAENGAESLFKSGKVAMIPQGSWMVSDLMSNDYVKENADVAVLPKDATTGKRISIYNGLGWTASANTKSPDNAWKLIEYLTSKDAQQKQSDLGVTMSAYDGTSDNWKDLHPEINLQAYLDMKENLVIRPYSKSTVIWENYVSEKLIDVWTGTMSAEDACKEIANKMNELLKNEEQN
ncbi:sugar ABC transporter substrate-binding protein [Clostridium sp. AL.422]|uniref:ABC transporter substrate-binding protein n=1 Tax=Clostridium TaxID=1485 RepID=UPI00293DEF51|nr:MULTISPECIES: sugar ABC transporter substrate-binding protein [unclassified Clostridium]MDV4152130.1 sugar ABC transporter substrate-binding protein [Clostridium sp. AL.422]